MRDLMVPGVRCSRSAPPLLADFPSDEQAKIRQALEEKGVLFQESLPFDKR
jgi:hypothetical protein